MFLGLIGTGLITIGSRTGKVNVPDYIHVDDKSPDYQKGFREGFNKKAKKKNFASALTGGLLGTGIGVTTILLIEHFSND